MSAADQLKKSLTDAFRAVPPGALDALSDDLERVIASPKTASGEKSAYQKILAVVQGIGTNAYDLS